jgi:signal peptide peptidase SppA
MKLADIVNGPWAITLPMFAEVQSIYATHMRGDKIDLKGVEARIGKPLAGPTRGYDVAGDVAIIPLDGVLAKRMNLLMSISGGTSTQQAGQAFQQALDDPSISAIILAIDSPGGTVDGTQALANQIFAARGQKPIIALADGVMASAAYWIGSAADQIFVADGTTTLGSIGVVATHTDVSGSEAQRGVKTTEVTAGKYKRIASAYEPLSADGRQSIQDSVDYTYSLFVNDVARNRGTTPEAVIEDMADGRLFMGEQALQAGLADGMSTLQELVARAQAGDFAPAGDPAEAIEAGVPFAANDVGPGAGENHLNNPQKEHVMDVATLKNEHPDVAAALIAEGRAEGAAAERDRIAAIEDVFAGYAGNDALLASLKADGKTTGPEAAVALLAAEKGKKADRLASLRADAADAAVTNAAAPEAGSEDDGDGKDDEGDGEDKYDARAVANIAARARAYQADQAAKGNKVSTAEAVAAVSAQLKEGRSNG